jgi:hypothetical protein
MINELTELALEKAQVILGQECSPIGLMASPEGSSSRTAAWPKRR